MRFAFLLVLPAALGLSAAPAAAFPTEDDVTPGRLALDYTRASATWARVDAAVVDGKVTTSPPNTTSYDRSLEMLAHVGADAVFSKSFGIRLDAAADAVRRRQADEQIPRVTTDQTSLTVTPAVDLTFVTEKGLELFGGVVDQVTPASTQHVTTGNGTSTTHFHAASVMAQRFGLVRRSGAWEGGFYYVSGAQKARQVDQAAFDSSFTQTQDYVFIPSEAGVVGAFKAFEGVWDFDLTFVQARGLGPQDNHGHTTQTDFFVARVGSRYPLGGSAFVRTLAAYQTQAYARSAFVTLDTIPVESLKLLLEFGAKNDHAFLGIIAAYGRDGQSLPEFNARYQMAAGAVSAGYDLSL